MSSTAEDVAEFYHQLYLLTKSDLPLPQTLRQLASQHAGRDLRNAALELGDATSRGHTLGAAMRQHPGLFPPFHIRLVEAGEKSGTLPETLSMVARFARMSRMLTRRLLEVIGYPLFVVHLCLAVLLGISVWLVPQFHLFLCDLAPPEHFPAITRAVLGIGSFIEKYRIAFLVGYALLLGGSLWLFVGGRNAHRALFRIVGHLPGGHGITRAMDSARFCRMWSALLGRGIPMPESLDAVSELVQDRALREALQRAGQRAASGRAVAAELEQVRAVDPLIVMTLVRTPEQELTQEIERLSEIFEYRAALIARSASVIWTTIALVVMCVAVGLVIMSLFSPLIAILRWMSM